MTRTGSALPVAAARFTLAMAAAARGRPGADLDRRLRPGGLARLLLAGRLPRLLAQRLRDAALEDGRDQGHRAGQHELADPASAFAGGPRNPFRRPPRPPCR